MSLKGWGVSIHADGHAAVLYGKSVFSDMARLRLQRTSLRAVQSGISMSFPEELFHASQICSMGFSIHVYRS